MQPTSSKPSMPISSREHVKWAGDAKDKQSGTVSSKNRPSSSSLSGTGLSQKQNPIASSRGSNFFSRFAHNFKYGMLSLTRSYFDAIPPEKASVSQITKTVGLVAFAPLVLTAITHMEAVFGTIANLADSICVQATGRGIADPPKPSAKLEALRTQRRIDMNVAQLKRAAIENARNDQAEIDRLNRPVILDKQQPTELKPE